MIVRKKAINSPTIKMSIIETLLAEIIPMTCAPQKVLVRLWCPTKNVEAKRSWPYPKNKRVQGLQYMLLPAPWLMFFYRTTL